jgi:hypothetical protein
LRAVFAVAIQATDHRSDARGGSPIGASLNDLGFTHMKRWMIIVAAVAVVGAVVGAVALPLTLQIAVPMAWGESLERALELERTVQVEAAESQRQVEALDDEGQRLLREYREALRALEDSQAYRDQLVQLVADQRAEIARREAELEALEATRRQMLPLMGRMVAVLGEVIAIDAPFLPTERRLRQSQLAALMDRADLGPGEKLRRILEAYQVEARYGQTLEAYTGPLDEARTVEFLRLGRVGLYYLTLDGAEAGVWDRDAGRWAVLDPSYREPLQQALRIARRQAPPDLVRLPVPAPEVAPGQASGLGPRAGSEAGP